MGFSSTSGHPQRREGVQRSAVRPLPPPPTPAPQEDEEEDGGETVESGAAAEEDGDMGDK